MSKDRVFHPSYGYLSPEQVEELRAAKWDGSYAAFKDKVLDEGMVRKPRAKRVKTTYMFTPETDGRTGS